MTKKASFALGCFWHPDEIFSKVPGVVKTRVGYSGGHVKEPTYEMVCSGSTGHAETVEVEYDPEQVSYEKLLQIFWQSHDPTQVDRQGPDIGNQYRSVIFTHDSMQHQTAEKSLVSQEEKLEGKRIATKIETAVLFYPAEEYHQKYNEKQRKGQ